MVSYQKTWSDAEQTRLKITVDGSLQYGRFQDLQSYIFSLKEKPPAHITFDLSEVKLIDSSGLGLLMVAHDIIGQTGQITLQYPQSQVEQLLNVCKVHELMEIQL